MTKTNALVNYGKLLMIAVVSAGAVAMTGCASKEGDRDTAPAAKPAEPATPAPVAEPEPVETPAPGEPEPAEAPTTPDECTAAGGTFVASTGAGATCPEGQRSLGPIRFGIEGGVCCK